LKERDVVGNAENSKSSKSFHWKKLGLNTQPFETQKALAGTLLANLISWLIQASAE